MNVREAYAGKRNEARILDAAIAVFDAAGVAWLLKRGRHLCIEIEGGQKMPIASSPRDCDAAVVHAGQQARRMVRKLQERAR